MSLIVVITNKTNLASVSDYNYEVLVGDGSIAGSHTLARGSVQGHERASGWKPLVQRVLDDAKED